MQKAQHKFVGMLRCKLNKSVRFVSGSDFLLASRSEHLAAMHAEVSVEELLT